VRPARVHRGEVDTGSIRYSTTARDDTGRPRHVPSVPPLSTIRSGMIRYSATRSGAAYPADPASVPWQHIYSRPQLADLSLAQSASPADLVRLRDLAGGIHCASDRRMIHATGCLLHLIEQVVEVEGFLHAGHGYPVA